MKIVKWKTKIAWGFYVAVIAGALFAILMVPASGGSDFFDNPVTGLLDNVFGDNRVKVIVNGETIAIANSMESGKEAYKAARLHCNEKGLQMMDIAVSFDYVDKERDGELLKRNKTLKGEALENHIYEILNNKKNDDYKEAYTMRIDDYTVTLDSMEEVIEILEKTQGIYDTEDAFRVNLKEPSYHNVTTYEVTIEKREDVITKQENPVESDNEQLVAQSLNDGVKNIGFSDPIQITSTYAKKGQITDMETAYSQIVEEKGEEAIYVVQPGDYMELIAQKNNMDVATLKELNPQITSDEDLYYDDRLNVMVPTAAVQVMVEKQETYEENYYADVVYEDDDSMYIGESTIVQEGQEGKHIVTDLVTYKGDVESGREQLEETVEVAAVAQVVRRGTKSRPTYMYPMSTWNVTSNFGYRWGRLHGGTDVGVPIGTTVRASRSGQVTTAGWVGGYGNCVMIDHGDGVMTVYGHLSQVLVSVGQYVDQGQQIALSGNTGRSTGPHLHFEVRVNGSPTDATPYLEGRQ
ncbi:MAG: peptidoglycan DD-metalloendopeptidase family protein [Lachnospiraceae bacterium]